MSKNDSLGYYLYSGTRSEGVERKIKMQVSEFEKIAPFTIVNCTPINDGKIKRIVRWILPLFSAIEYKKLLKTISPSKILYVRRPNLDIGWIRLFANYKKMNPSASIIYECPVYPYYKDVFGTDIKSNILSLPIYIKDRIYRSFLHKYVDYVSTFSDDKEIFGIPTLKIYNGIVVDKIKPISSCDNKDGVINLFSVALMAPHHGFERLLYGLKEYYDTGGSRNIIYHCVGYGAEEKKYREIVNNENLEKHVVFYGKKTGDELEEMYEEMDLAVASLGIYKIGLKVGSFIKIGEYLSKGIPIVTGSPVDVLDHEDFPYFIEFPNDASNINIDEIVDFYDQVYGHDPVQRKRVISSIREYAYKKVDMTVALRNVTTVMIEKMNSE